MNSFVTAYTQCELMVLWLLSIFFPYSLSLSRSYQSEEFFFFAPVGVLYAYMISVFVSTVLYSLHQNKAHQKLQLFRKQQEHVYSFPVMRISFALTVRDVLCVSV